MIFFANTGIQFHDVGPIRDGGNSEAFQEGMKLLNGIDWFPLPYTIALPHVDITRLFVRGFFRKHRNENHLTVVIDTTCDCGENPLRISDVDGQFFNLTVEDHIFWQSAEVVEKKYELATKRDTAVEKIESELQATLRMIPFSTFRICRDSTDNMEDVDVSLVLDFGNSRTGGMLVEVNTFAGATFFEPLVIRSYIDPIEKTRGLFETSFEFVPPRFTDEDKFFWHSLVRVGYDAKYMREHHHGSAQTGMSSPKRYLWDNREVPGPWTFSTDGTAITGSLTKFINPSGDVFSCPAVIPTDVNYPYKAGLLFLFYEILSQASCQINCIEYRKKYDDDPNGNKLGQKRNLKEIILSYPSGMHTYEIKQLEKGVQRAIDIWHASVTEPLAFRTGFPEANGPGKPDCVLKCDEASSIQIYYLFREIMDTYLTEPEIMFSVMGNTGEDNEARLRIASIDIGGGTTDFAVIDYHYDAVRLNISRKRRFLDGATVGGHDIMESLIANILIGKIAAAVQADTEKLKEAFSRGGNLDGAGKAVLSWSVMRQKLVEHLWIPLCHELLEAAEADQRIHTLDMKSFFESTAFPETIREDLDIYLESIGGQGIANAAEIEISLADVTERVKEALGEILQVYCNIISKYNCDIVLFTGRPSSLPVIERMVREYCPISPQRIVFMKKYIQEKGPGQWLPDKFKNDTKLYSIEGMAYLSIGRILGAAVAVSISDLSPDMSDLPIQIGLINPKTKRFRKRGDPLFIEANLAQVSIPHADAVIKIGIRRVNYANAVVNPLYELKWEKNASLPKTVPLVILEKTPEQDVRKSGVEPGGHELNSNSYCLDLKTIYDDRYWLDTGEFQNQ